jgi:hypothetical protein
VLEELKEDVERVGSVFAAGLDVGADGDEALGAALGAEAA